MPKSRKPHKNKGSIRQRAKIPEEDDVVASQTLHTPTAFETDVTGVAGVAEVAGISEVAKEATEESQMQKKIWHPNISQLSNVQRVFYPQIAADKAEPMKSEHTVVGQHIKFSTTQTVYIIECKRQRVHKRQLRGRADAWRRYGPLQTIHRIGGWVHNSQHKDRPYKYIKPGTRLNQPPPKARPIMTFEEFLSRPVLTIDSRRSNIHMKERPTDDTIAADEEIDACSTRLPDFDADSKSSRESK